MSLSSKLDYYFEENRNEENPNFQLIQELNSLIENN